MARVLVVDDEEGIVSFLAEALERSSHEVATADRVDAAMALLAQRTFDLVLTDLRMPGGDGMTLVRHLRANVPETEVIVLTAHGAVDSAVEAMKLGAFDYLQKPLPSPAALRLVVERALERRSLLALRERVQRTTDPEPQLTYGDPAMTAVVELLRKVAATTANLLLLGESGVGKEVAARAIHAWSARANGPFAAINCAVLSEHLLESELFGHERGAFTGAHAQRRGRLELAEGGSFFLDEVGELRPELQARLLRVLQDRRFERVGGSRTLEADVRWIAATNGDLQSMVRDGAFREDLYHRLAVFPVRIPPLRERRDDIAPIARWLLLQLGRTVGRPELTFDAAAENRLRAAAWPGNVRELRNVIERAVVLAEHRVIGASDLWIEAPASTTPLLAAGESAARLRDLERAAIAKTLDEEGGNRRRTAERLGIGLRTLYEKLKRYDLG